MSYFIAFTYQCFTYQNLIYLCRHFGAGGDTSPEFAVADPVCEAMLRNGQCTPSASISKASTAVLTKTRIVDWTCQIYSFSRRRETEETPARPNLGR